MQTIQLGSGQPLEVIALNANGEPRDISSATGLYLRITRPSDDELADEHQDVAATFSTDGDDGAFRYAQNGSFIDEVGVWKMQGLFTLGGLPHYTAIGAFRVNNNL